MQVFHFNKKNFLSKIIEIEFFHPIIRNINILFTDFEYVLGYIPTSKLELEPLKQSLVGGMQWYIEIMRIFQIYSGIKWSQSNHVEQVKD